MMADRSLGQVAYEKHAQVFSLKIPWDRLRPLIRSRWEAVATAVIEECGGGK